MLKREEPLWVQEWWESERGWGQKCAGYSLHFTREDLLEYATQHLNSFKPKVGVGVPDFYEFNNGSPFQMHPDNMALTEWHWQQLEEKGYAWIDRVPTVPGRRGNEKGRTW